MTGNRRTVDLPALFIDVGDRLGTESEIIGEKNIVLAGLRIAIADATQTDRALLSRMDASELDGLVTAEPQLRETRRRATMQY